MAKSYSYDCVHFFMSCVWLCLWVEALFFSCKISMTVFHNQKHWKVNCQICCKIICNLLVNFTGLEVGPLNPRNLDFLTVQQAIFIVWQMSSFWSDYVAFQD